MLFKKHKKHRNTRGLNSNKVTKKLLKRPIPPEQHNYIDTHKIQIKYSSIWYHIVPIDQREK